jgi:hypothetical protein
LRQLASEMEESVEQYAAVLHEINKTRSHRKRRGVYVRSNQLYRAPKIGGVVRETGERRRSRGIHRATD